MEHPLAANGILNTSVRNKFPSTLSNQSIKLIRHGLTPLRIFQGLTDTIENLLLPHARRPSPFSSPALVPPTPRSPAAAPLRRPCTRVPSPDPLLSRTSLAPHPLLTANQPCSAPNLLSAPRSPALCA
ncbi:hypothetical protein SLEP1_g39763 [Rubroshorea leprosula]|uniref:Uncharacterized protein n=1 Tax=Rubroshorea leprosula TaxID=152421 RepID=A0AAV5L214_9ROSI|nr:hypothetical protein SLEP1_g39763 [Rubroshorea leprosula]